MKKTTIITILIITIMVLLIIVLMLLLPDKKITSYKELEEALETAAENHYSKNKCAEGTACAINPNQIDYLDDYQEEIGATEFIKEHNCEGIIYSTWINDSQKWSSDAYIKCDNYKTNGYDDKVNNTSN